MSKKLEAKWTFEEMEDIGTMRFPIDEDPNMTDAERVWDRLKNGIREQSLEDLLADTLAKEVAEEIDREILEDLLRQANNEDKK